MPIFNGLAIPLADLRAMRGRLLHRIEDIYHTPTPDGGTPGPAGRIKELQTLVRELEAEISRKERAGESEVVRQPRARA